MCTAARWPRGAGACKAIPGRARRPAPPRPADWRLAALPRTKAWSLAAGAVWAAPGGAQTSKLTATAGAGWSWSGLEPRRNGPFRSIKNSERPAPAAVAASRSI